MSEVIVIASGKGGTGKTTVCACLAVALAKAKNKVLIIDCDSGMRGIDMMLGISDALVYDISDIISGECTYTDALYRVEGDLELYSIAAPLYADDEVSPSLVKQLVGQVREDFDYILIDTPPLSAAADVTTFMRFADKSFVVVRTDCVYTADINDSLLSLKEKTDNFAGCILNAVHREFSFLGQLGLDETGRYSRGGSDYGRYSRDTRHR